jgi:hypothetical protein
MTMQEVETVMEYDGRFFTLRYLTLVPPQTEDVLAALKKSIREHGVLDAVKITHDDIVIDGTTRLRLAKKNGIPLKDVPLIEMQLSDEDATVLAVSLNSVRRQLTKEHRVLMAHRLRRRSLTLAKIAKAIGCSVVSAHAYLDEPDPEGDGQDAVTEVEGADGKVRPAKYRPRAERDGSQPGNFSTPEKLDGGEASDPDDGRAEPEQVLDMAGTGNAATVHARAAACRPARHSSQRALGVVSG